MTQAPWTIIGWAIVGLIALGTVAAPLAVWWTMRARRRAVAEFERRCARLRRDF